jgi:Fe-S cluster biogenesis protein NfuA
MADQNNTELKERVAHILATEVEPAMQLTSGSIQVLDVTDGVVRLRMGEICASCPSSLMVIVMELEEELRKRIPEVAYLEAAP